MGNAAAASRVRGAVAVVGLAGVAAFVFASAARMPLFADDYYYLDRVQSPGWWHSRATWDAGRGLFRPILFLWFGLLNRLFGLHPLPFHIATGLIVVIGAVMTSLVARRLGLRSGAYAAAAFYCLHASMATPIAWASAASSPLATALALGALYRMLRRRLRPVDVGVACGLFLVALMTREVVAVTPAVLVIARYVVEEGGQWPARLRRCLFVSLPLWLVLVAYAVVRRLAGFEPTTGAYEQRLNSHGVRNFGQLMRFATEFGFSHRYTVFVVASGVALIGLCAFAALHSHRSQGLIGLAWVLLGVLPVIFLAVHRMEYYYIDFALPGLALAVGTLFQWIADALSDRDRIVFAAGCLIVFAALSSYTARKEVHAYLTKDAARTAQLIAQVRRVDPSPAKGSMLVVRIATNSDKRLAQNGALFRVIFHDPSLRVTFTSG